MDGLHESIKTNPEKEVTLKELITMLREWVRYLFSKWWIVLLFVLIGGALGFSYALLKKKKYSAQLTFIMEDSKAGGLSAYAGLASQFGIDLSGGGSGIFTGDNIIEFLKSKLIVQKALLTPTPFRGKSQTLAEMYIDVYEMRNKWQEKPLVKDVHFLPGADRSKFSLVQDSVLEVIYDAALKNNLVVAKPDKKLGFIAVTFASLNDTLSKVFVERLVKEATDFYIDTKTQRSRINVSRLQERADSIENLLNKKTYSAAVSQDLNLNPAKRVAMVSSELIGRDKIVLQTMYGEVVKNLEMSKMAMSQETPIIQVVDTPILPLKGEKVGKVKGTFIGGVLGGLLIILVLVGNRMYRQIMK